MRGGVSYVDDGTTTEQTQTLTCAGVIGVPVMSTAKSANA